LHVSSNFDRATSGSDERNVKVADRDELGEAEKAKEYREVKFQILVRKNSRMENSFKQTTVKMLHLLIPMALQR
jgi:hypothetical protein